MTMSDIFRHRAKVALRGGLLTPVGKVLGAPTVHISSPLTRGGNYLYYWMWAYTRDTERRPVRVLHHEVIDEWLTEFPLVSHLSIRRDEASTLFSEWVGEHRHYFGQSFTRAELERFCIALVESSPAFRARLDAARSWIGPDTCVLNVRRGDYYQYPELTAMYGLDIERNITGSIEILRSSGRAVDDVVVVSDDVPWCVENVAPLLPGTMRVVPERTSMFDDLAVLASARTLILANSTFSFWGGYLASVLQTDHLAVAPEHHFIDEDGQRHRDPYDPRWRIAEA
ncbi:alpha-1,2-fucosyltransferase [Cryobacterium sp. 1639]|uniref:alpha-1,2-fucosyltransferase n=1 Tax=Cryobacterium inferilacus TaxID=2866629 RepID=UPI001C72B51C|nr:alpha-1,2-fucosyltransferase [Cryobacterium sp. 1639]MBX0301335.1 alpha-1,2-fucosyltransferase [Cryobacterium sp. 1639]